MPKQVISMAGNLPPDTRKNHNFWSILLYFRASRVSPIDSARRDLSNGLGEMKIGVFLCFLLIFGVPDGPGSVPDGP